MYDAVNVGVHRLTMHSYVFCRSYAYVRLYFYFGIDKDNRHEYNIITVV